MTNQLPPMKKPAMAYALGGMLALLWAWPCNAAGAALVEGTLSVRTNLYVVTGSNLVEILYAMRDARPWGTNHAFHATTDWKLDWTYRHSWNEGRARLDHFKIRARAVVTLPRWNPTPGASVEMRHRWQRYLDALTLHEEGHVRLARHAVSQIRREVSALKDFATKQELEAELRRITEKVLASTRQQEREYDRRTGHGVTQGASL